MLMLPFVTALLFSLWFMFAYLLLNGPSSDPQPVKGKFKINLAQKLKLEEFQDEAEAIGWKITKKEFTVILIFTIVITLSLAMVMKNPLVLPVGFITGLYLPRFLIEKKRKSIRLNMISKLTNPLRNLLSRIPDQQNITKAIELTRNETVDETIRSLFDGYIKDVSVGLSVKDALINMKKKVKLKKFDLFIDNLVQAHYDGFTADAGKALDKAVEVIEFDLRAIEKVREQSRDKKRKLYTTLGIIWFFPPILSMISSGNENIYLNTLQGRVLIFLYVLGTLYVFVKGEEYLSLNLDEL